MAYKSNMYYADPSLGAIAQSIGALMSNRADAAYKGRLLQSREAETAAQIDNYASQIRERDDRVRRAQNAEAAARGGAGKIANAFFTTRNMGPDANPDVAFTDQTVQQTDPTAIRRGVIAGMADLLAADPQYAGNLGKITLAFTAQGAPDNEDMIRAAFTGAGNNAGPDFAATVPRANQITQRKHDNSMTELRLKEAGDTQRTVLGIAGLNQRADADRVARIQIADADRAARGEIAGSKLDFQREKFEQEVDLRVDEFAKKHGLADRRVAAREMLNQHKIAFDNEKLAYQKEIDRLRLEQKAIQFEAGNALKQGIADGKLEQRRSEVDALLDLKERELQAKIENWNARAEALSVRAGAGGRGSSAVPAAPNGNELKIALGLAKTMLDPNSVKLPEEGGVEAMMRAIGQMPPAMQAELNDVLIQGYAGDGTKNDSFGAASNVARFLNRSLTNDAGTGNVMVKPPTPLARPSGQPVSPIAQAMTQTPAPAAAPATASAPAPQSGIQNAPQDVQQRRPGQTYMTLSGPRIWSGRGWIDPREVQ